MNRKYRKTVIAGNWKMNKTPSETKEFMTAFKAMMPKGRWCDVALCVPAVCIPAAVRGTNSNASKTGYAAGAGGFAAEDDLFSVCEIITCPAGKQYQAAPGLPGIPGKRRHRWRCG